MKPEKIREELTKNGVTLGMIADALGHKTAHISKVINRVTTSRTVANHIASILDKTVSDVFPDVTSYSRPAIKKGAARQKELDQLRHKLDLAS